MPNLSDDPRVARFFLRLDAPLCRMPEPERADLHTELRQHLETLVAAQLELGASPEEAIESALSSFGDPTNVGRKLMREWRLKNRDPFWATIVIIGVCQFVLNCGLYLWLVMPLTHGMTTILDRSTISQLSQITNFISPLLPLLGGVAVGLRQPSRAVFGAFFAGMLAGVLYWLFFMIAFSHVWRMPSFGVSGMECLAAYVVSSIKRRDWTLQIR